MVSRAPGWYHFRPGAFGGRSVTPTTKLGSGVRMPLSGVALFLYVWPSRQDHACRVTFDLTSV